MKNRTYRYNVKIVDMYGESVAWFSSDNETECENIFNKLDIGAGGEMHLLELSYIDDKYIETKVLKSKK